MKSWLLIILFLYTLPTKGQIINTFAGGGRSEVEGVQADSELLHLPHFVTFDKYGDFYFSDESGEVIRKVDRLGIITTVAGTGSIGFGGDSGLATAALLKYPEGVTCDTIGNLYIADHQNFRIRKVNMTTGIITTIAGTGVGTSTGDGGLATAATFFPNDIRFDSHGNLYITDGRNNDIRKIDTAGIISTFAGTGTAGFSGDSGLATAAELSNPYGIAIDSNNNIYFTDGYNYRIRKIDTFGIITTIAGTGVGTYVGDGMPAIDAQISPLDVAIDRNGIIYLSDGDSRIRMIDSAGIIHTVVGTGVIGFSGDGGPADSAEIYGPTGITFDACGNIYFGDAINARVRKVTYNLPDTTIITITATPGDTVCAGTVVTFSTTVTGSGTLTYQWYVNGTAVSALDGGYSYTPANGDSVRCVCIATSPCNGADTAYSNTIHIVVNPVVTPTVTVTAPESAPIGTLVTVNATVTGAGSSYNMMWYDDGAWFATTTVPTTSYTKTHDIDTITATVTSTSVGCWDSSMSSPFLVGDTALGTLPNPPEGREVLLYPNPVHDHLTISQFDNATVVITDVVGQVMYRGVMAGGNTVIDVSNWAGGVYILTITEQHTPNPSQEGNTVVRKIVKE